MPAWTGIVQAGRFDRRGVDGGARADRNYGVPSREFLNSLTWSPPPGPCTGLDVLSSGQVHGEFWIFLGSPCQFVITGTNPALRVYDILDDESRDTARAAGSRSCRQSR